MFFLASGTLNKQQIAGFVGTIYVCVGGLPALVALRNDIVGDVLTQALVKNEILATEFIGKVLLRNLACVVNDAAVKLVHVLEAVVLEVGGGLFAANASCAIQ